MVNKAYADADNREPSFFPGINHFELYPNEENQKVFQQVLNTGEPHRCTAKPFEYLEQLQRGETYWDWELSPFKDVNHKVQGVILSLIDVTERVRTAMSAGMA